MTETAVPILPQRFMKGLPNAVGAFAQHGVSGRIIEPATTLPLRPPVAIWPDDLAVDKAYAGGPTFVMRVPGGFVDPTTGYAFDSQRRLIRESAIVQKYAWEAAELFPSLDFDGAVEFGAGEVHVVTNQRPENYCRWWLDTISKYYLFETFPLDDGPARPPSVTLTPPLTSAFHKASLDLMGYAPGPSLPPRRLVRGDLLISKGLTSGGGQNISPLVRDFGAFVLNRSGLGALIGQPGGRKVYISRQFTGMRRILNEAVLRKALKQRGFEIVVLEKLAMADQMRVFAEADVIISPHGAGLTNVIFCNAGTLLIEIFPDIGVHSSSFRRISTHMDMDYALYAAPSDLDGKHRIPGNADLTVDVAHLAAFCDDVMENRRPSKR
jgi:hypothetical protein